MIGIYAIKNKINNKIYIGQSIDIESRLNKHLYLLNVVKDDSRHLQRSWDKYGEENFEFQIVEVLNRKEELNGREIYWIDFYKTANRTYGYNISGGGGNMLPSKETLEKMSKSLKETWKTRKHPRLGKKFSEETKKKMSEKRKGVKLSEDHKQKLSEASKRHKHTEKTKEKISESNKGKVLSEETKKKISESKKGSTPWNKGAKMDEEYSKMISERFSGQTPWNKGKAWSEKTKRKISESKKGKPSGYKIQPDQYPTIIERLNNGEKPSVIAFDYNVTVQTIYNIKKKGLK